MVALHYLTDHFDGKVGKYRNTGLFKWGFYMDHFLDYVFLCSVFIGYALILPKRALYHLLLVLAVFSAFMFNSFLVFTATEEFRISLLKLGPTEFHIALIVINSLSIHFGVHHMESALPYVAACSLEVLALLVYRTQKRIWLMDAKAKGHAL